MNNLSPLIVAVFMGLFSLAQIARPWDPESPMRKWKSCSKPAQVEFVLSALYFTIFFIVILVISRARLGDRSQLPLELSWLYGLSIEAVFLWRTYPILNVSSTLRTFRIFLPIIAANAALLQIVGFGVLSKNDTTGRSFACAGGILFHLFSAAAIGYLLTLKQGYLKWVLFTFTFLCAALASSLLILLSDTYTFFYANCILECCMNFILLVPLQDEGIPSTSSSLTSLSPISNETSAGDVVVEGLKINVEQTVITRIENHGLPTPPSSPSGLLSSPATDTTNNQYGTPPLFTLPLGTQLQGVETLQIHPLECTGSSKGISVQVIAIEP